MHPGLSDSKFFVLYHTELRHTQRISKPWPLSQSSSELHHSISFLSITKDKWRSKAGTFLSYYWWVFKAKCGGKSPSVTSMKLEGQNSEIALPEISLISLFLLFLYAFLKFFLILVSKRPVARFDPPVLPDRASAGSISFQDLTGETACQWQDSDTHDPPVRGVLTLFQHLQHILHPLGVEFLPF